MNLASYFDPTVPRPAASRGDRWTRTGKAPSAIAAGVSEAAYRAFPGINSSLLKEHTAAEMWHSMHEPPEDHWDTDDKAKKWTIGILLHWAVLEPWKYAEADNHIVISPTKGLATKKAQAVRAETGLLVVTPELVEQARECLHAVQMHPLAQQLLNADGAEREVCALHWNPELEVWQKGRFDFAPRVGNYLLDVKTTAFPLPQFPREARKFGYHVQAAWYLDLWEAITGERREIYYLLAVSKSAPFMARLFHFDNWPKRHPLYEQSPLKAAREILEARRATWLTAAHETRAALASGLELSPQLTRSLWPAYEQDQPASQTMLFN